MSLLELVGSRLPVGWSAVSSPASEWLVAVSSPEGVVMLDFQRRKWFFGRKTSRRGYRGRGWRDRLVADALAALRQRAGGAA